MAYMAFLLLIFMLATTQFKKDEGLKVVLSDPLYQHPPKHRILPGNRIYFKVVAIDTVVMIHRKDVVLIHTSDIKKQILRKMANNPELKVSIRTSPNAPYVAMINVLDEIKTANPRIISIGMLR